MPHKVAIRINTKIDAPVSAFLISLLISTSTAFAQTPTASVVGRVTDSSGAVLPGVTITVRNPDTNISSEAVTNGAGDFTVLFLNPARYVLEASLAGFRTYQRSVFTLEVEQTLRLDVRMELGAVTKSGTNKFRGAAFEFLRNDALDAKGYFDPTKSPLSRHQFGATVGGPVVIPGLYNGRNRTFFLATWESLRSTAGQTQLQLVPTPAMLKGDFSGAKNAAGQPIDIIDPITKLPFPNNQIPSNRLDPVALNLVKYYPAPNLTGDSAYNYAAQGTGTDSYDNIGVKIDHAVGGTDRLTGSVFRRPSDSCDPLGNKGQLPYFGTCNPTVQLLTYVKYLRTISSSMFLETSVNFSRRTNNEHWPESGTKDWAAETGFYGTTTDPIASGPPNTAITGYATIGVINAAPKIWEYENRQATVNLTYVRGRHTMKMGGDFLRYDYLSDGWADTRGRVAAQGAWTGQPVADFLLGYLQSSRRALGACPRIH